MKTNAEPTEAPVIMELHEASVSSLLAPESVRVNNVDWVVRQGEFWIIGGLPASGKSDLLATAAGLMRPQRGIHRLFGEELSPRDEVQRLSLQLRVAVVFGNGGRLFTHLTVAENLALPFCYHRNCDIEGSEDRVRTVLRLMGLEGSARSLPASMTRSLRQRASLARALILAPELLFLDNPLAALEPPEVRWWIDFLEQLAHGHPIVENRPLTIVIGTDDLAPWNAPNRRFGLIQSHRLQLAENQQDLLTISSPGVRGIIPTNWPHH